MEVFLRVAFIVVPTLCYFAQAAIMFYNRDIGVGWVWLCYGLANIGFIINELHK